MFTEVPGYEAEGVPAGEEERVWGSHMHSQALRPLPGSELQTGPWLAGEQSHCGEWGGLPCFPALLCLRGQQLGLRAAQVAV